jgi:hypothetical protein
VEGCKDLWAMHQILSSSNLKNRVLIASSNLFFTGYIEYKFPDLLTVLEGFDTGKEWVYSVTPSLFRPDFVAGFFKNVDKFHIEKLRGKNLLSRKIIYGISSEKVQEAYCEYGITKMIVDYDNSIEEILKRRNPCEN